MDIHTHSEHSHDAEFQVAKMCEAAIENGIGLFAITDHYDIYDYLDDFSGLDADLRQSVSDTLSAREQTRGRLKLFTGIELGQPLENQAKAEEVLQSYAFDFVLGSLHNAPGRPDFYFYKPDNKDFVLDREIESYFVSLLATVRWGRFDSAGHLTLPFRYVLLFHQNYNFRKWDDYLESIVKALAEKGMAMEINTSGVKRSPSYTMPDTRWARRFKELGGEKITLGSDAHSPQRVGAGLAEGMQSAYEAGFSWLCYFENRAPQYVRLADYM
jgi:histidinol-phosphatase (PHP family)